MESSVLPLEFNGNTDWCIIQNAMLQSVQSNVSEAMDASASGVSIHECFRIAGEKIVIQQAHKKEIALSGSPIMSKALKQPKVSLSRKSNIKEVEGRLENRGRFHTVTIPRYLNLEPSLAMDWLEISWDELHIKERVGAGTMLLLLLINCFLKCFNCYSFREYDPHFMILFFPYRFIWNSASCWMAWIG